MTVATWALGFAHELRIFILFTLSLTFFVRADQPIDLASTLLRERAILFKEKTNFKLPGSDGFKAHQDI